MTVLPGAAGALGAAGAPGSAAALADLVLPDDDGLSHRLGDAWLIRPVVLAFLRHFGCLFCRRRAAELVARRADIIAAGAGLAVVGLGTPAFAKAFREDAGWRGPIYVDAEAKAYAAAGLVRAGPLRLLRPRVLLAAVRARKQGFRQGKTQGDPWQMGGTLVVAPRDRVVYAWRNASAEDDAPVDEVLAAVRGLVD